MNEKSLWVASVTNYDWSKIVRGLGLNFIPNISGGAIPPIAFQARTKKGALQN